MPRFFIPPLSLSASLSASDGQTPGLPDILRITGADAQHIRRALRMREGEVLTLSDGAGTDYAGTIAGFEGEDVLVRVRQAMPCLSEPDVAVTLYQGLPKGDKMEWIVQKAVELGVTEIVPVTTARSVVRLEDKAARKRERWQKIADEAAGQSGRGRLPAVETPLSWPQALERLAEERAVVLYEGGGEPLAALVERGTPRLSLIVGPEGGFAPEEIEALRAAGAQCATLGRRILRCETAPLAALAIVMQLTGNME